MKCLHCGVEFHDSWTHPWEGATDIDALSYSIRHCKCPSCKRSILVLQTYPRKGPERAVAIHPRGLMRSIPAEVPPPYSDDFREAVEVLPISPKASAALSRRNLQAILRDVVKVKKADLSKEIQEFVGMPTTPAALAGVVDAVRHVGNLAAHPTKDTNTGMLVEVEADEADWLLDVLDALFDFCFVQPARNQERKAALNNKLQQAGKPPMK